MKMKKYPYGMGSAVLYSSVLLATLWWIPVVGPIIVGYITGRKAGGPFRGLVAMSIPIALYLFAVQAIARGWINLPPAMGTYLQSSIINSSDALPYISYFLTTVQVASNVGTEITSYLYYAPPSFFIMLSFAFIGGTVSRQIILERGLHKEPSKVIKKAPKIRSIEVPEPKKKEMKVKNKKAKKSVKTKKVHKFEDVESSKFVIHPMDTKKKVPINGRKVHTAHGIVFL
jgi:hypothetical protein